MAVSAFYYTFLGRRPLARAYIYPIVIAVVWSSGRLVLTRRSNKRKERLSNVRLNGESLKHKEGGGVTHPLFLFGRLS